MYSQVIAINSGTHAIAHAPNATPDAASGASAGLAVAGPVEMFRHAPNAMPDAAGAASGLSAGRPSSGWPDDSGRRSWCVRVRLRPMAHPMP